MVQEAGTSKQPWTPIRILGLLFALLGLAMAGLLMLGSAEHTADQAWIIVGFVSGLLLAINSLILLLWARKPFLA